MSRSLFCIITIAAVLLSLPVSSYARLVEGAATSSCVNSSLISVGERCGIQLQLINTEMYTTTQFAGVCDKCLASVMQEFPFHCLEFGRTIRSPLRIGCTICNQQITEQQCSEMSVHCAWAPATQRCFVKQPSSLPDVNDADVVPVQAVVRGNTDTTSQEQVPVIPIVNIRRKKAVAGDYSSSVPLKAWEGKEPEEENHESFFTKSIEEPRRIQRSATVSKVNVVEISNDIDLSSASKPSSSKRSKRRSASKRQSASSSRSSPSRRFSEDLDDEASASRSRRSEERSNSPSFKAASPSRSSSSRSDRSNSRSWSDSESKSSPSRRSRRRSLSSSKDEEDEESVEMDISRSSGSRSTRSRRQSSRSGDMSPRRRSNSRSGSNSGSSSSTSRSDSFSVHRRRSPRHEESERLRSREQSESERRDTSSRARKFRHIEDEELDDAWGEDIIRHARRRFH